MNPISTESLLRLPIIKTMISDKTVPIIPRGIDQNWYYHGYLKDPVSGFNPFVSQIFTGKNSALEAFTNNPLASSRLYNQKDRLVYEIFFAVHDYIHAIGTRWINELTPQIGYGSTALNKDNIEDHVFCFLITEALATVGLDYWYLSTIRLNELCSIGTQFKNLTVSYREEHSKEYKRFMPTLKVQQKSFYEKISRFYCSGVFPGVDVNDLKDSPLIFDWLEHELSYGALQRKYSRQWLFYFAEDIKTGNEIETLKAPIRLNKRWKKNLLKDLSFLLWDLVKNNNLHHSPVLNKTKIWRTPSSKLIDFRFKNYNILKQKKELVRKRGLIEDSYDSLFEQYLSQFQYKDFDKRLLKIIPAIKNQKDLILADKIFSNQKKVPISKLEPENLFILS